VVVEVVVLGRRKEGVEARHHRQHLGHQGRMLAKWPSLEEVSNDSMLSSSYFLTNPTIKIVVGYCWYYPSSLTLLTTCLFRLLGVSGLACAQTLMELGMDPVVYDTGNHAPGGRCSSRVLKLDDGKEVLFDHSAQVRDPPLQLLS